LTSSFLPTTSTTKTEPRMTGPENNSAVSVWNTTRPFLPVVPSGPGSTQAAKKKVASARGASVPEPVERPPGSPFISQSEMNNEASHGG
jgi:hypothetical protein